MYLYARVIRSRSESATKRRSYKEIRVYVCADRDPGVRVCVCDCYIDLLPRIIGAPRAYTQYIYNNIILRPSGGVSPESSRRTCVCVYILYVCKYFMYGEVYTHAHAATDSAGTHVRRRRYL